MGTPADESLKRIALKAVADQRFMKWKRRLVSDTRAAPPVINVPVRPSPTFVPQGVRATGINCHFQQMPAWMRKPLKPPGR